MGTTSCKVTLTIEIDGERLGDTPIVRRIDATQFMMLEQRIPPLTGVQPSTFLPAYVGIKKIALFHTDKAVTINANGTNENVKVCDINPGGYLILVDGTLGNLAGVNADAVETATVEQLFAGDVS